MKGRTSFEPMREREPLRVMPTREFPTPTPLPGGSCSSSTRNASEIDSSLLTHVVSHFLVDVLLSW